MIIILLSLVFFYFGALLGFTLLSYTFFWYEACNSDHRDYLRRISKNKVGRWLANGVISSLITQNLIVLFFPFCFWRRLWNPEPDATCSNPPILLLHGLFHNASAWMLYRWILRRRGFRNTYAVTYNCLNTDFSELQKKVAGEVDRLSAAFPDQRIILIGHSLGGLLATAYAEDRKNHDKIFAVVTLGAPHRGSKLAALGINHLARSLIFQGKLVRELREKAEPSEAPKLAIYSPIDNLVLPNDSLQITEPGWSSLESLPVSHIAMLYHRRLANMVVEYLLVRAAKR